MRAQIYYALRKLFNQEARSKIKVLKYDLEKKMAPMRIKLNGTFTPDDLKSELKKRLPDDFEVLMVHSSFSSMIPMYQGNLTDMLKMLLDLCKDKTLVMPAFFFGERKYHFSVLKYYQEKPMFDASKMPSQMGMITEMFRKHEGVVHSMHPTHRISALGPLAEQLTTGHELCQTGCGAGSPFEKMAKVKTVVLGMGAKYYQCITQSHSPEDLLIEKGQYPSHFELNKLPIHLKYGDKLDMQYELLWPDKTPYDRQIHPLLRKLLTKKEMFEWNYHGVPFFYAWADKVTDKLVEAALDGKSVFIKRR